MRKMVYVLAVLVIAVAANANVVLTGIIDGFNSTPKGIELYVDGAMDLTGYTISIESNGGATEAWYVDWTFGAAATTAFGTTDAIFQNQFIYITATVDDMVATFASATTANTYYGSYFNCNGNDAIRMNDSSSALIDQLGIPTQITGSSDYAAAWCYMDSYAYRVSGTGPDGGFTIGNWTFAGNDYLDTNANTNTPFGTYVPEPATMLLLGLGGLLVARKK